MSLPFEKAGYDNLVYLLDCSPNLHGLLITGVPTVVVEPETTPPLVASDFVINAEQTGVYMRLSGGSAPYPLEYRDYHCQLRHATNEASTVMAQLFTVRVRERV